MKYTRCGSLLLGLAVVWMVGPVRAEGWGAPKSTPSAHGGMAQPPSSAANALKRLNAGTKRFVRGAIDVVTLKPLWEKKQPSPPSQPWLNNTTTRKNEKKKSFWGSLFAPSESSEPKSMKDFVGMKRPT